MNRQFLFVLATSTVLLLGSSARAVVVTFSFDPNAWVSNYSTDTSQTRINQDNPRLLIDGVAQPTDKAGYAGQHTTYSGASYSSNGIEGYATRVQSVEIHDFNMWLADGINAPNWGEVLTQVAGSVPSGTAGNGWAVSVGDNPWPQAGYGTKLVTWYDAGYWDDDPETADNPLTFGTGGIDFGNFTLTVDVNTTDVHGTLVDFSKPQTIWLGTGLPVSWTPDPDDLVYSGNRRFEGTMRLDPVPEPGTIALLGTGLVGLIGGARRRMRK